MRNLSHRHPRTTAFLILGLFAFAFAAPTLIYGPVDLADQRGLIDLDFLSYALRPQFAFAASVVFITFVIGWGKRSHLTSPLDRYGMRIALIIGLVLLILFASLATVVMIEGEGENRLQMLLIIVALNLMVGVFEEVLFRGILFAGLRARHSLTVAVVGSSVLFGLFHVINLSVGQSLSITVFQVVNATAIGLFLCAIMLQANSLWPAIILHAIWNCYAMAGQLLINTVPLDDMPEPSNPGPLNYLLPVIIMLAAAFLLHRWRVRMDRPKPPPIPPHSP